MPQMSGIAVIEVPSTTLSATGLPSSKYGATPRMQPYTCTRQQTSFGISPGLEGPRTALWVLTGGMRIWGKRGRRQCMASLVFKMSPSPTTFGPSNVGAVDVNKAQSAMPDMIDCN